MEDTIICDGELEIVKITEDLYDQAVELYQNYFMRYENVAIATKLLNSQQSVDEMELLIRAILVDGISFAARDRKNNQLVAMSCNKILCPRANCTLEEVCATFKSPSMLYINEFLERMETSYDLFENWNIDCVMEIVFLSTRSDYTGKGLATKLSNYSIEYIREFKNDTLSDNEIKKLPPHIRHLRPEAVCSIFTSRFSQKVGEKLGFETVFRVPLKAFSFDGKTFDQSVDPIHEYFTFTAKRL